MRRVLIPLALGAAMALGGCYYDTYPSGYSDTYYAAGHYWPVYGYGYPSYYRYPYHRYGYGYGRYYGPPLPHHVLPVPAPHHVLPVPLPHHW